VELLAVVAVLALAAVAGAAGLRLGMLAAPRVGRLAERVDEERDDAEEGDNGR
jgi:hypothetical protein